ADAVVVADDQLHAIDAAELARVGLDAVRANAALREQTREHAVSRADLERRARARGNVTQHAQKRRGEEADQDVNARADAAAAKRAVENEQRSQVGSHPSASAYQAVVAV